MRKKVWMALAGCVILGLSGCGSTASDTAQEVQDSASEDAEEETSEKVSWYGTRVVTETKAAEVSALSEEEISGKVGNTVTYEANTVQINEEQLEIEGYETMQDVYTPDSIKEDYKADLSDWEDGVENISFGEVISSEDQDFFGDLSEKCLFPHRKGRIERKETVDLKNYTGTYTPSFPISARPMGEIAGYPVRPGYFEDFGATLLPVGEIGRASCRERV